MEEEEETKKVMEVSEKDPDSHEVTSGVQDSVGSSYHENSDTTNGIGAD